MTSRANLFNMRQDKIATIKELQHMAKILDIIIIENYAQENAIIMFITDSDLSECRKVKLPNPFIE